MKENLNGVTLTPIILTTSEPRTSAQAIASWKAGNDWRINHPNHRWNGKPCSISDMEPGEQVKLRYDFTRKAIMFTLEKSL